MEAVGHDGGPRGSPAAGERVTLHCEGRPRWGTTRMPENGREANAAWWRSATMEDYAVR